MVQTTAQLDDLVDSVRSAIEQHRDDADELRRLPPPLADILRDAGLFGLNSPIERGGLELSLTDTIEVYEQLGRIDGAVAWNIWNGNLGFSAAMLSQAAGDLIWTGDRDPIIANSARVVGGGIPVSGGVHLSGRWDMVSAIDIADWVALFGVVLDGDGPRMTAYGPDVRAFFLPTKSVDVLDTWYTTGMRGTGSKTVIADTVFVPDEFAISPFAPSRLDRPLYRIPAFTLASSGSAPIVIGIAQAAIDEVVTLAATKPTDTGQTLAHRGHAQSQIAAALMSLEAARLLLSHTASAIDAAASAGDPITELLRARLRAAMSHAASASRSVLSTCQLLASSSAVYTANRVERLIRDGQTAAQHMILSPTHADILGRLTFGLPADTAVF